MTAGERFRNWIDEVAQFWANRLRDWMAAWLSWGLELILDVLGKSFAPKLRPLIDTIEATGKVPPELQPILDELKDPTGQVSAILAQAGGSAAIGGAIGMLLEQLFADVSRGLASVMRKTWIDLPTVMEGFKRGTISPEQLYDFLKFSGFPDEQHEVLKDLTTIRLDPMSIVTAWRRDPEKYNQLFSDLKDQGWSPGRIEALKFITLVYPSRQDGIRYVAKEALEPEAIAKYGLMDEFDKIDLSLFKQIGVPEETVRLDWIAHWEHASWMQMVEMLHRGLVTEEDVYEWFRVVEMVPHWRDLLIQTAYTWPTRVDVRRWWDMRTIDETELRRLYSGMGYRGVNLDNYVLWTKVYVAFPDLMARWSKGWITLDQVRSELTALGMPAERVEEMIQTKIKTAEPERVEGERNLTKTDIYKGVKQGRITRGEAIELLMDLGFDEDEADYLLFINIPPDEEDVVVSQRELTKADILKGLKTEVITRDEARTRLLGLRYSPADAEFLLKIFDAQVKPPVEPREREASKADIILAVKKGLITPEEAYLMLLDLDFTPEAATFILEVKAEVSPFSPVNFAEFKDLTQKYRVAAGMEAKPMPEEIKTAADEVVKLTAEVEALERSIVEEKRGLIDQEVLPEETTKRLKSIQVKRNRAISQLAKAKNEYDRLIAEWRHEIT